MIVAIRNPISFGYSADIAFFVTVLELQTKHYNKMTVTQTRIVQLILLSLLQF